MRFKITWRDARYFVSIPSYDGGEVVTADEVKTLEDERDNLRIDLRLARQRVEVLEAQACRTREALKPFALFGKYIKAHPRCGLHNDLYSWDTGEGSIIRKSDLITAHSALASASPCSHELQLGRLEVEIVELKQRADERLDKSEKWRMASDESDAEVKRLRELCGKAADYIEEGIEAVNGECPGVDYRPDILDELRAAEKGGGDA